jgi:anaerobic carbon-monoxide dehydrogenase iron sulfur subunit
MKKVYPNKEVCIGCHLCEVACLTAHSKSRDVIIAYKEEKDALGLSPCKTVIHDGPACVALSCRHCDEPACVAACISGALTKNRENGRTEYDEDKCVGCWSCVMACPFGSIRRHPIKEKIVKCDLCAGRDVPACVEVCPNWALVYEDRGEK